jgi:hypothetical protein
MATIGAIRDALRAQPFQPFDIKLVDGTRYIVPHPDYVSIPPLQRPREITYYTVLVDDRGGEEEYRTSRIDLSLISGVITPSESRAEPGATA